MPELPEVETIRNDLRERILRQKITAVEIRKTRLVKNSKQKFINILTTRTFVDIRRRGKLMIFVVDRPDAFLLIHLKMTGQLIYRRGNTVLGGGHSFGNDADNFSEKYSYVIFSFANGAKLFFNDMRQFGYLEIVSQKRLTAIENRYGIEPLSPEFTFTAFNAQLHKRTTTIKVFLLNQAFIAGIGNIYADEICFGAGVLPTRKITTLTLPERKKIYSTTKRILKLAVVKRGTTFNNYVDSEGKRGYFANFLHVYGRKNEPCHRCKTPIKKIKIAGRGTHFCPNCQK